VSKLPVRLVILSFGGAAFLGSALLFLIEPMIVKMVLPRLGGSPSVWITAMVFFQATLLVGYSYAHVSTARLGARAHAVSHVVLLLLPLLFLPVALPARWMPPPGAGSLWVFLLLVAAIGVPFFVLSTVSPVLQRWYSQVRTREDPYFLYAIGNLGSLLGLLAYPLAVERFMGLAAQSRLWTGTYVVFLLFAGTCAWMVVWHGRNGVEPTQEARVALSLGTQIRWVFLAFVPSSLLLGATSFLTAEVGSFPLLWVLPLAVYLITFIVAFARKDRPIAAIGSSLLKITALIVFVTWALRIQRPLWALIGLHCTLLLAAGLAAHGRLHEERPPAGDLTRFYLLVSLGGVLGGMFNALASPILFVVPLEYPLVLVLALLIREVPRGSQSHTARSLLLPTAAVAAIMAGMAVLSSVLSMPDFLSYALVLGTPVLFLWRVRNTVGFAIAFAMLLILRPPVSTEATYLSRTFFGVYRVSEEDGERVFFNGMTIHGTQLPGEHSRQPTAYYHLDGPLGDVFSQEPDSIQMVVIGLGAGGIAAYGSAGTGITFIEIDPEVVDIARNEDLFTYLSETPAEIRTVVGDGRLGIGSVSPGSVDLVILDAFTGDAIPVHLLTVEALTVYASKLNSTGKIVINISNRYFALEPVIAAAADTLGLDVITRLYAGVGVSDGAAKSQWMVLARDSDLLAPLRGFPEWRAPRRERGRRAWTDDYSNLLSVVR